MQNISQFLIKIRNYFENFKKHYHVTFIKIINRRCWK